jgi:hypothetical protein
LASHPDGIYQSFVGDWNRDGQSDVALRNRKTGMFYIRFGPGFSYQQTYQWDNSHPGYQAFVGDWNNDKQTDVALRNPTTGMFYIRFGPGFSYQQTYQWDKG